MISALWLAPLGGLLAFLAFGWWMAAGNTEDALCDLRDARAAGFKNDLRERMLRNERDDLQQRVNVFWEVLCAQADRLGVQYDNIAALQEEKRAVEQDRDALARVIHGYRETFTLHSCQNVKAYTGQKPPKCNGGKGCIGCAMKRAHYVATHPAPAK